MTHLGRRAQLLPPLALGLPQASGRPLAVRLRAHEGGGGRCGRLALLHILPAECCVTSELTQVNRSQHSPHAGLGQSRVRIIIIMTRRSETCSISVRGCLRALDTAAWVFGLGPRGVAARAAAAGAGPTLPVGV
jgi:hypothetical protein